MAEINWEEAPDWANGHYLCNDGKTRCWMKVGQPDEPYQYCFVEEGRVHTPRRLSHCMRTSNNWKKQFTPRPEKAGRKNMELKEFKKTPAYDQLRRFIEVNVPDVEKRPAQLGLMVKRAMARLDLKYWNHEDSDKSINWLCRWNDTPEGENFWLSVDKAFKVKNIHPCPIGKRKEAKKPAAKKEEKPARVGWW